MFLHLLQQVHHILIALVFFEFFFDFLFFFVSKVSRLPSKVSTLLSKICTAVARSGSAGESTPFFLVSNICSTKIFNSALLSLRCSFSLFKSSLKVSMSFLSSKRLSSGFVFDPRRTILKICH